MDQIVEILFLLNLIPNLLHKIVYWSYFALYWYIIKFIKKKEWNPGIENWSVQYCGWSWSKIFECCTWFPHRWVKPSAINWKVAQVKKCWSCSVQMYNNFYKYVWVFISFSENANHDLIYFYDISRKGRILNWKSKLFFLNFPVDF